MAENIGNDYSTTLTAAISSAGATTISVASVTGAPSVNFRIRIDDEIMLVTGVSSLDYTVTRGVEGTTATTHLNGAAVAHVLTKVGVEEYSAYNFGIRETTVESGRTVTIPAGRQLVMAGTYTVLGTLEILGDLYVI